MHGKYSLKNQHAFSLVELLVVMGVIGIMMVLAVPAFQTMAGTKGIVNAGTVIQGTLEFAKNEAQTRQTYVWVGFKNTNNALNSEALITVLYSIDGTATNTNTTNMASIGRLERFENIVFTNGGTITSNALNVMATASAPTLANSNHVFTNVLTFTPSGQVLLTNATPTAVTPYISLADIRVVSLRGTNVLENCVIDILGATGTVKKGSIQYGQ